MNIGEAFDYATKSFNEFTQVYLKVVFLGRRGAQHKSPGSSGKRNRQKRALERLSRIYEPNMRELEEIRILKSKLGLSN